MQAVHLQGSGGAQLQNVLVRVVSSDVQQRASSKYDPIDPSQGSIIIQPASNVEGFRSSSHSSMIAVVGVLCIVYGVIAK